MDPVVVKVPPKLYEPLFILSEASTYCEVPLLIRPTAPQDEADALNKASSSNEPDDLGFPIVPTQTEVATLHVAFAWSDDGMILSAAMTDCERAQLSAFLPQPATPLERKASLLSAQLRLLMASINGKMHQTFGC